MYEEHGQLRFKGDESAGLRQPAHFDRRAAAHILRDWSLLKGLL